MIYSLPVDKTPREKGWNKYANFQNTSCDETLIGKNLDLFLIARHIQYW